MADVNLGVMAATTLQNYHKKLVDNIFKKHALLDHLKNNGGTKMYDGGRQLVAPVMYGANTTAMRFSGVDTLDNTYQDGIDASTWDWKYYNVAISFSLEDKSKNRGKSQIINLLEGKIKQAELSLAEMLNTDLITGTETKGVVGLDTIIGTTTEVGGINGTTYTWWRSSVDSTSEGLSFADMRTAKNTANNGNGGSKVSLIVTTQTLYERIFALLTASYYMNSQLVTKESKRLADASFEAIEFEGVPVVYDEAVETGDMFFINVDNYKLGILEDLNFKVINKSEPTDQHVEITDIVFGGAAYTDRRASLAKLTAKTTA